MLKLTYSFSCLSTVIKFIAVASIHQRLQDTSRGRIDLQMPRDQIQVPRTDYAIAHTQCMTEYITGQTAVSWNSNCCNDKVISPSLLLLCLLSLARQIARDINLLAKLLLRWQLMPQLQQNPIRMPFEPASLPHFGPFTYHLPLLLPPFFATPHKVFFHVRQTKLFKIVAGIVCLLFCLNKNQIQYHAMAAKKKCL